MHSLMRLQTRFLHKSFTTRFTAELFFRSGVGISGAMQTMFYVEVTDDMKVSAGGGLVEEGELIHVLEVPLSESRKLLEDDSIPKPAGFLFAIMWFYENIKRPDNKWFNRSLRYAAQPVERPN